ncbi:hypothetical protein ABPG72_003066 [Tetrahymena utriculariae]
MQIQSINILFLNGRIGINNSPFVINSNNYVQTYHQNQQVAHQKQLKSSKTPQGAHSFIHQTIFKRLIIQKNQYQKKNNSLKKGEINLLKIVLKYIVGVLKQSS